MALVWLRIYPTCELLGFFFGLHKRNARRNASAVLAVLDTFDDFPFDRPGRERDKVGTLKQVMTAFPAVRLVIDRKEQRVQRPQAGYEAQKPYYSGKKKTHTFKCQVAVRPDGLIESVRVSVPGDPRHQPVARDRPPEGVGGGRRGDAGQGGTTGSGRTTRTSRSLSRSRLVGTGR